MLNEYKTIRESILEDKANFALSDAEQFTAYHRFCRVLKKDYNPQAYKELPYLIKSVYARYSECFLAEVCYEDEHPCHGDQMSGRDLKRWAAIELDEFFNESGLLPSGDFWHEK
jgi:hypothetical protein